MDEYELYHHGIKGMKWGVRRFQKKNGSLTPAGKKRQKEKWSDDANEASKIKKKSVKEMSNAELKRLNERTRLEQEYSRLNPSKRKKVIAAVTATAATMGTLLNLYNNSDKLIAKGKPIAEKLIKPISRKFKQEMAIGLWSDIHSDELYHYGVKGMKWGTRKDQLESKVKKQQQKRKDAAEKHGVGSRQHRAASKNLYLTRSKYNLEKAKANNDQAGKVLAKNDIRIAKEVKRDGSAFQSPETQRKIYGYNISRRDMDAISIVEAKKYSRNYQAKRAVKASMSIVGPIALAAVGAEATYYQRTGKLGVPKLTFIDGKPAIDIKKHVRMV